MAYSSIAKPTDYFNTVLYTGNAADGSSTTQDITGVGFQPDWVWIKGRDNANSNFVNDAVRGANKALITDGTNSEITSTEYLKSFASDGFQLGGDGIGNGNGNTYVSWNWKANGSGSSNSDGSITSTASANTTAGFSIVKYTGTGSNAAVGHGLGSAPEMIIFKNTNSTRDWGVYHAAMNDPDAYLALNRNYAKEASYNFSNNTAPTSSVFSVGTLTSNNGSSQEYIAYCFAEKTGYSKFGSYTGNGSASGTFVYTGFKPAFVIRKRTDTTADWRMDDNKRPGYNVIPHTLFPNGSNAETSSTHYKTDLLSNGFKCYGTSGNQNASGGTYIYMAFAAEPLVANVGQGIPASAV